MVKLFDLLRSAYSLFREYVFTFRSYDNSILKLRQERTNIAETRKRMIQEKVSKSIFMKASNSQLLLIKINSKQSMELMADKAIGDMERVTQLTDDIVR